LLAGLLFGSDAAASWFEESAAQSNADVIVTTPACRIVDRENASGHCRDFIASTIRLGGPRFSVGHGRPKIDAAEYQVSRVFLSWKTLKVGVGKPRRRLIRSSSLSAR
jgi:hypothetical protein